MDVGSTHHKHATRKVDSHNKRVEILTSRFMNIPDKCLKAMLLLANSIQSVKETYSCWLPRRQGCW